MESKKLQEKIEAEDVLALTDVLSSYNGRYFIWWLLEYCGIYQDCVGDGSEVHRSLGRRQVGLKILSEIGEIDEEKIFTMMREAKSRAQDREKVYEHEHRRNQQRPSDRDIIAGNYEHGELDGHDGHHYGGDDELRTTGFGGAII